MSTKPESESDRLNRLSSEAALQGREFIPPARETAPVEAPPAQRHARANMHKEHRHDTPRHQTHTRIKAHLRREQSRASQVSAPKSPEVTAEYTFPDRGNGEHLYRGKFDANGNLSGQAFIVKDGKETPTTLADSQREIFENLARTDRATALSGSSVGKANLTHQADGSIKIQQTLPQQRQDLFNNISIHVIAAEIATANVEKNSDRIIDALKNHPGHVKQALSESPEFAKAARQHMIDHPDDKLSTALRDSKVLDSNQVAATAQRAAPLPRLGQ